MSEEIRDRAAKEAEKIFEQFERLELLGNFVAQDVRQQKLVFLTLSLANFARREIALTPQHRQAE